MRWKWQFSLRTLLVVVTATSVLSFAAHKLRTPTLVELVEEHNRLKDERNYSQMLELIDYTYRLYPDSPVTEQLLEDAKYFLHVLAGNDPKTLPANYPSPFPPIMYNTQW